MTTNGGCSAWEGRASPRMDDLSFLYENGMSSEEVTRLQGQGLTLAEIAASARRMVFRAQPYCVFSVFSEGSREP